MEQRRRHCCTATCSSCPLFSSHFLFPYSFLLLLCVPSSSPFLFPYPSLLFPFVLSSSSTLSVSLSLSSFPICLPQHFFFPVFLSLLCSRHLYSSPLPFPFSFSFCLSASVPQRDTLFYFSVAKHSRQVIPPQKSWSKLQECSLPA